MTTVFRTQTIFWEELQPENRNATIHSLVFQKDPEEHCSGDYELMHCDVLYDHYKCRCGYLAHIPRGQRAFPKRYLHGHKRIVPDYVGSFEGALEIFQAFMASERYIREKFEAELNYVLPPNNRNMTPIQCITFVFALQKDLFEQIGIAALRAYGYKVKE